MLKREVAQARLAEFEVADVVERRQAAFAKLPATLRTIATDMRRDNFR